MGRVGGYEQQQGIGKAGSAQPAARRPGETAHSEPGRKGRCGILHAARQDPPWRRARPDDDRLRASAPAKRA
eukprot:273342-Chlamydomonas_euryale.AAC.10